MKHFAGLDVAMEETAVCVVDLAGRIVHESTVATDPSASRKKARMRRMPLSH